MPHGEDDLGALFARITRRLIDAERPLLAAHGTSMWEYIALSELGRHEAESQLAFAEAIGYDKARLVALLDKLQADGLISREPDPADRRARRLRLTEAGRERQRAIQRDIRAMEEDFLAELGAGDRRTLRALLAGLARP